MYQCRRRDSKTTRDFTGARVNKDLVDVFTFAHFGSGYLVGKLGFGFKTALALAIFWDFYLERALKCEHPEWFPHPSQDSLEHVVADTGAYLVGWKVGSIKGGDPK